MTPKSHKMKQRIAIFPGSFNPFTIGHHSIVERGLQLFDKIIIAIGYNEHKQSDCSLNDRISQIKKIYARNEKIEVISFSGLTVDCAKNNGAEFILRGVRNTIDFEYERSLAEINRKIGGLETVLFYTLPQHNSVSSSMVRELMHNGLPVDEFLPPIPNDKSNTD